MKHKAPTALVILDGFGYSKETKYNAIAQAHTPCINKLIETYPTTLLKASGMAVGLPEGQAGNSEVGHLTIGSGSVILQPFTMINNTIKDGTFFTNSILIKHLRELKKTGKTLHLIGLLSDASVHSNIQHLFAFLQAAKQQGITNVIVHPFLDGRDVAPQSAQTFLEDLEYEMQKLEIGKIGSIHGRMFAMDRNKHWNLTEESFYVLTEVQSQHYENWQEVLKKSYEEGITDEFIKPFQVESNTTIKDGDGVIFFNFRPDRARQLTTLFLCPPKKIKPPKLAFFITPVSYGKEYPTTFLYKKPHVTQTLTQVLHDRGFSIYSIAETEKYAHITYFLNGGREVTLANEKRVLVPSLESRDYEHNPKMSAETITDAVVTSLQHKPRDFYVINYANADMVGHTGNFAATIKAVECLDKQITILYEEFVKKRNGTLYITADHGNAEEMFDPETNQPKTSHTTNPVLFIMAQQELKDVDDELPLEELSDIAPFIVHTME